MSELIRATGVFQAKRDRDALLANNPRLQAFQKVIQENLDRAGDDPNMRMLVLKGLLMNSAKEMGEKFVELQGLIKELGDIAKLDEPQPAEDSE